MDNGNKDFVNNFQEETDKKKETVCEIGFWISILGLILSFFGMMVGVIIYILDFYFAFNGLKTRKKGKAIATIVISIISIVVIIFQILLA